jgi:transcriptional regulator with XRE-family HTH domain
MRRRFIVIGGPLRMTQSATTLGKFITDLMEARQHSNRSLAAAAGVSEGAIRNILKYGEDSKAREPDARTLRLIADALRVNPLRLYRLAGYLPPAPDANSVRAEYLADVFDALPPEKQDAVMGVLEAMADEPSQKTAIKEMRQSSDNAALEGMDLNFPAMIRDAANQLIVRYAMTVSAEVNRIEPDTEISGNAWRDLPLSTRERITALIRHKLLLNYDPTMVDPEWRE